MAAGFEFLEHTADIGIKAWGPSVGEAFEQAANALVELMGTRTRPSRKGSTRLVSIHAPDLGALLVRFLDEVVFLSEADRIGIVSVHVVNASSTSLEADVALAPIDEQAHGLGVKAATYHQLTVETRSDGCVEARVFLDI